MRKLALRKNLEAGGGVFAERYGCEIVTRVHEPEKEYNAIRKAVGITDFSFMQKFTFPEDEGLDHLDALVAGNVARVRFGRVLHTFHADRKGMLLADCYIANNDDELVVLCESIEDDGVVRKRFMEGSGEGARDLTDTHIVLGIDGYRAWEVAKKIFGIDILGLPYLSIERYTFNDVPVQLFRCGKTSEFGYLVMAPVEIAPPLFERIFSLVRELDGVLCGSDIHNTLRLEGRFFNVFAEGERVGDPLSLGLQWMIDFDKDNFPGCREIATRRKEGIQKKIVGIQAPSPLTLETGKPLFDGDTEVGVINATCYSFVLGTALGLALFEVEYAYAGLTFHYGAPDGPEITTISMPPIMPKSLSVKLDEL